MRKDDLLGQRFGRLVVVGEAGHDKSKRIMWLCICDCGKETIVRANSLKHNWIKSCGCLNAEMRRERSTKHNLRHSKEYRVWDSMRQRCSNPNSKDYPGYGGRGIKVCERWQTSFAAFYEDMGPRPGPEYSIDRIDNDGDYTPENCRWATRLEQAHNRRGNVIVTFNGRTQCLTQWATELKLSPSRLSDRLAKGWSIERALTTPPLKR